MSTVTYNVIPNQTQALIQSFLAGEESSFELSTKVLNTFDLLDTTSYPEMLERIKGVFKQTKGDRYDHVFVLRSPYELSSKEKAVLVRFINISYKGNENIIVLDNNVVHIGSAYNTYDSQKVKDYIEKAISELHHLYQVKERNEKFNRWKDNLFHSFRFNRTEAVN